MPHARGKTQKAARPKPDARQAKTPTPDGLTDIQARAQALRRLWAKQARAALRAQARRARKKQAAPKRGAPDEKPAVRARKRGRA